MVVNKAPTNTVFAQLICCCVPPSLPAKRDIVGEFIDVGLSLFMPLGPFLIGTIVSKNACLNYFIFSIQLFHLSYCV